MRKISIILSTVFMLSGCDASYSNVDSHYVLPEQLSTCHIYYLSGKGAEDLHVVVCPNSSTTTVSEEVYSDGKTTTVDKHNTTVISSEN